MTVERARRDVSREPRPWCARARLRGIVSSDTSRRHVRPALPRADAASYRAPRRVIDACRVRSRRSPRRRVRDARASSPVAPRLHPHRLTSPRLVLIRHRAFRVPVGAGRRQARRGDRADQREAPGSAFLRAGRRHHRVGPVPGRRRVLHSLQSRLGRCARARRPPMASRALGTRKNAHRIPYASLERSLPSDEEPPNVFRSLRRRGGVRARRGHDPRVVRGGGGGHGRRYARSRSLDAFPADARVPDDSETAARRNADSDPRSRPTLGKASRAFFFAILFQSGNRRNAV